MDFVKNRAFYHVLCFFGGKSSKKRLFFGVLDKKESFLDQKKKVLKKYKKIEIFQRGKSIVFVKKSTFLSSVFLGQINQNREDRFFVILDKKILFRPEKGSFEKTKKNLNFPKGLVHGFCHILIKSSNWLYARYH